MKAYMIKLAYTRLVFIKKDNKKVCTCQVTLASDLDNKKGCIRLGSTYSYKKMCLFTEDINYMTIQWYTKKCYVVYLFPHIKQNQQQQKINMLQHTPD
jgi:hypothetical protein